MVRQAARHDGLLYVVAELTARHPEKGSIISGLGAVANQRGPLMNKPATTSDDFRVLGLLEAIQQITQFAQVSEASKQVRDGETGPQH